MKIAKCKCGGQAILTGKNKNIPQCPICKRFAMSVDYWNTANTDQYGQQLTKQSITWVEWDGDVEHLPPEQTRIFYRAKSEIDSEPVGMIGNWERYQGQPCLYFWRCSGKGREWKPKEKVYILIQKGDQFAVVGEDSHAS